MSKQKLDDVMNANANNASFIKTFSADIVCDCVRYREKGKGTVFYRTQSAAHRQEYYNSPVFLLSNMGSIAAFSTKYR